MNKDYFIKRIIIGTANFSQKYGYFDTKVGKDEILKILNFMIKKKLNKFDTSENYLINKDIFSNISQKFIFNSKISFNSKWSSLEYCEMKIKEHLSFINSSKINVLFFHGTKVLYTKKGLKIFENLKIMKKKNFFNKIGVSVYDPYCLNYLLDKYKFDAVQCSYNILDKRLLRSGWLEKLKKRKVEIHLRSIFLQGLLVNKIITKNYYFKKWKKEIYRWFSWLKKNKISPLDYCLSDLMNLRFDYVVLGIDSLQNLKEIINFKIITNKKFEFTDQDIELIEPRKWMFSEKK